MTAWACTRPAASRSRKYARQRTSSVPPRSPRRAWPRAYATLAADGKKCPMVVPSPTVSRKTLPLPPTKCEQVVEPDVARRDQVSSSTT